MYGAVTSLRSSSPMAEYATGTDETSSRKRKIEIELTDRPIRKHVCCVNDVRTGTFVSGESFPENAKHSSSPDSVMSHAWSFPKTSGSTPAQSPADNFSEIISNGSASYNQIASVREDLTRLYNDYGLNLSDIYDDYLLEFEDRDEIEKDVDELRLVTGESSGNRDTWSENQSLNGDSRQRSTKKTIDKEFEEYFSMLLL